MHDGERIKSRSQIVYDNAGTLGQPLQSPNRKRLPNIKGTEQYKAGEKSLPSEGDGGERNQLSRDFVNNVELWILRGNGARDSRYSGDFDKGHSRGGEDRCPGTMHRR